MYYSDTPGVIIYWNPDHIFVIHRAHDVWFYYYNHHLYIEDNHTPGYLLLQQDLESFIHNSELLNLIPCELDIKSTLFCDTTILTYEIELPPSGKKIGFNLLDYEDFIIPYVTDKIINSPSGCQLPT